MSKCVCMSVRVCESVVSVRVCESEFAHVYHAKSCQEHCKQGSARGRLVRGRVSSINRKILIPSSSSLLRYFSL